MQPYYEADGITIYCGDCREIIPQLPKVDLVITSQPYNIGLRYSGYNDRVPRNAFRKFTEDWLRLLYEACNEKARFYSVMSDEMLWWYRGPAQRAGFKYCQVLPWCKPNMASGGGRISGDWNNMVEWVLLFRKGKRTSMLNGEGTSFSYLLLTAPQRSFSGELHKQHVAQFPVELPRRLISRTPGDLVLDPFCGSGSTLLAAKQLGRNAIGIELSEADCQIAVERLRQRVLITA